MSVTKKTKIIATLGPASSSKEIIEKMMLEGVDVFRINFSHENYSDVLKKISLIRELNHKHTINTCILADLQGPKLRVGEIESNSIVKEGELVTFSSENPFKGNSKRAYMNYQNFAKDVSVGEIILLDDGKLIFEVIKTDKIKKVVAKVIQGGSFKSNKGVNLPNTKISLPALTKKDIEDVKFAIENNMDWIALSFVRKEEDLKELKNIVNKYSKHKIPIISKIEKPQAIKNISKIIANSDGLMVARGDLGVEMPSAEVPLIQKNLVREAKKARIPIIIATQMMETMIDSRSATRAEVNDVANSVMDGADAVMLSSETSVGKYPIEVIKSMSNIIRSVEGSDLIKVPQTPPKINNKRYITKSICYHASTIANEINAKAICTLTNSGYTAFQISAWRPKSNILVFTSNKRILTQLNLLWGVNSFFYDSNESTDKTIIQINSIAKKNSFIEKGDFIINLTSMPVVEKGMVNTLRISLV
ncbi:MAG: pyruvate kinase [Flavobacteriaceae bacterium]|nr:pyruvate kinase [Flavobacteriaceae bacterium]|tara:strand:+ start:11807 stop:13234 length:1428 start_codon:yes stop_codon:yes gene_type:complete